MRAKERDAWPLRNVGKGGKRPSYDAFNKSMKGHERNPSAKEFASQGMEGYHHYSEFLDTRDSDDEKKKDSSSSSSSKNSSANASKAANQSSSLVRNLVTKVASLAIGSVIVVNSYQTIQAHEEEQLNQNLITIVSSEKWNWSEDHESATLQLYDENNNLIEDIPTKVEIIYTSPDDDPTCTTDGQKVYKATVKYNGKDYSESYTQILESLGHDWVEKERVISGGKITISSECSRGDEVKEETFDILSNWKWSDDKKSATLELSYDDGEINILEELVVEAVPTTLNATCTEDGLITYSVSTEYYGVTYSDSCEVTLAMLNHKWVEKERRTEGGKLIITYMCEHDGCHEEFSLTFDIVEN